jgi:hypothetical protein
LKSAELLPAVILSEIKNPTEFADENALSLLHSADVDAMVQLQPAFRRYDCRAPTNAKQ